SESTDRATRSDRSQPGAAVSKRDAARHLYVHARRCADDGLSAGIGRLGVGSTVAPAGLDRDRRSAAAPSRSQCCRLTLDPLVNVTLNAKTSPRTSSRRAAPKRESHCCLNSLRLGSYRALGIGTQRAPLEGNPSETRVYPSAVG